MNLGFVMNGIHIQRYYSGLIIKNILLKRMFRFLLYIKAIRICKKACYR